MSDNGEGMTQYHAWPGVAHDLFYAGGHIRAVTMDFTFSTAGFLFTELTMVETITGIFQQCLTFGAQLPVAFLPATVDFYHLLHGALLMFDSFHINCMESI